MHWEESESSKHLHLQCMMAIQTSSPTESPHMPSKNIQNFKKQVELITAIFPTRNFWSHQLPQSQSSEELFTLGVAMEAPVSRWHWRHSCETAAVLRARVWRFKFKDFILFKFFPRAKCHNWRSFPLPCIINPLWYWLCPITHVSVIDAVSWALFHRLNLGRLQKQTLFCHILSCWSVLFGKKRHFLHKKEGVWWGRRKGRQEEILLERPTII